MPSVRKQHQNQSGNAKKSDRCKKALLKQRMMIRSTRKMEKNPRMRKSKKIIKINS
jgi:hypothetical protein